MPDNVECRAARPSDARGIARVLAAAFPGVSPAFFRAQVRHDATWRPRHTRVAIVDGKVRAHVRIFARTMLVRGVRARAGGIGAVATDPRFERRGLASALLRDAHAQMQRDRMALGFLFTGRTGFYQRLGWALAAQPQFSAEAGVAAPTPPDAPMRVRRIRAGDAAALLRIYHASVGQGSGAVARTAGTWGDASHWLAEDAAGCLVAERGGGAVAYVRARRRDYGYQIIEAECVRGHQDALHALFARVGARARTLDSPLTALAADDSALAREFLALPSCNVTSPPFPMMLRTINLRALVETLLPVISASAAKHRGPSCRVGLQSPDGDGVTLGISARSAALVRAATADVHLDADTTLRALVGFGEPLRWRAASDVAARLDTIFTRAPLQFRQADRI